MLLITNNVPNQEIFFLVRWHKFNDKALVLHDGESRSVIGSWMKDEKGTALQSNWQGSPSNRPLRPRGWVEV
jgi:hypothetical protein